MTVKLLVDWKDPSTGRQYRIGNLLDTDDYTEAGLIASKQAQADLTGGTAQTDPVVNHGDGQVVRANPAGTALVVNGNEVPIITNLSKPVSIYDVQMVGDRVQVDGGTEIISPYYDGTAESKSLVHPSLVYVPTGIGGYRYWLAVTPYPSSNSAYENPCIYASNDLLTWHEPTSNPIVTKPSDGYNADPHLYAHTDGKLYLMFTQRTGTTNRLMVTESSDGVNWSSPATVRSGLVATPQAFTSPSFWHNGENWVCVFHNTDATPDTVQMMSSADIYSWTGAITTLTIQHPTSNYWWHSCFFRLPNGRVIGVMQDEISGAGGAGGVLYLVQSDDMVNFAVRTLGTHYSHYRSTFLILPDMQGNPEKLILLLGEIVNGIAPNWRLVWQFADFGGRENRRTAAAVEAQTKFSVNAFDELRLLAVDGFTGTAGDLATTQDGKTWNQPSTDAMQLDGAGHATNENTSNCRSYVDVGNTDYSIQVRFHTKPDAGQMWLMFRFIDESNFWRVGWDGGEFFKLQSIVSGGISSNLTIYRTISAGDTIRVRCDGRQAIIYQNGQMVRELDMAGVHAAGDSVGIQASSALGCLFDDFVCHSL